MSDMTLPHLMGCDAAFEEAEIIIFGAGFDGTASFRPGSRFGPQAVRSEFYGLETYSPVLDRDITQLDICDAGDLELTFGDTHKALELIGKAVGEIINAGKKPFMIGGEHLITLPAFKAAFQRYPDIHLIHIDAHTDLRDEYSGQQLSHASVVRRIWEITGDRCIWQLGIRSGLKEEFDWAKEGHTYMRPFDLSQAKEAAQSIGDKPVYLTVDLDILDPSVLPGTGTPEPGGVSFTELMAALYCFRGMNIVAADMVELSPMLDYSGISTAAACKTMREMLLLIGTIKKQEDYKEW